MSDDLVTRLKDPKRDWPEFGYDRTEAAARIEALVKERDAANALLREIEPRLAKISGFFFDTFPRKEIRALLGDKL